LQQKTDDKAWKLGSWKAGRLRVRKEGERLRIAEVEKMGSWEVEKKADSA